MQLLLAFMPFIVFAVSISELGSVAALLLGALASAILVGHGLLSGRSAAPPNRIAGSLRRSPPAS